MINKRSLLLILVISLLIVKIGAEEIDGIDLLDPQDASVLSDGEELSPDSSPATDMSAIEEKDDLESLKEDIGANAFATKETTSLDQDKAMTTSPSIEINTTGEISSGEIFDTGSEEKKLTELSKFVETRIPDNEWKELTARSSQDRYVVQNDDWLWKISKKLFGSGFYYAKIWSLNPHIKNPHEIEPGTTLIFDSGNMDQVPSVAVGEFPEVSGKSDSVAKKFIDLNEFGDSAAPAWLKEREDLMNQGVFFQYASEETYDDLAKSSEKNLQKEYDKYDPPHSDILVAEPGDEYDASGFDKNSRLSFNFKEGFHLNTFLTTNLVQDIGRIDSAEKEAILIQRFDHIYVKFDSGVHVKPGDKFSVYIAEGKVKNKVSERAGYRYTVTGEIKAIAKINNLWECEVSNQSGLIERGDRITVHTPRVSRIIKTFSKRMIEAAIVAAYRETSSGLSFGDVVYLDRGRSDGVEMGTVFELFSRMDRGTDKRITNDPTYKIGELTVINLSDDFATALITQSSNEIREGMVAFTKTADKVARAELLKGKGSLKSIQEADAKALDELDVELNLDDLSEELLDKADKVRLSEDELAELERQEREKSVIKQDEQDLQEIEKLENEIQSAESDLNSRKIDEDKFLESQNLDTLEKKSGGGSRSEFSSLNEMESEIGRKYINSNLNSKENPYGLTEFDLEEIDELLNTDTKGQAVPSEKATDSPAPEVAPELESPESVEE